MYYQNLLRALLGSIALLFAEQAFSQVAQPKSVLDIVSNRSIWGKDFSLALAQMEALSKSDDKIAELSFTTLASSRRYANAQAADVSLKNTTRLLKGSERQSLYKKTKSN